MNYRNLGIALASLLAAGCITEGNYGTKLGATFCKKFEECDQASFDAQYDSQADCRDEAKENFNDSDSNSSDCLNDAGCKFSASAVRACRAAIKDASCDDNIGAVFLDSDCTEIYDCSEADSAAVAACFSPN